MSSTKTVGPAFPYPFYDEKGHCIDGIEGMTLRDYFAAKAMQGLLALLKSSDTHLIARDCYAMADAMLEARES